MSAWRLGLASKGITSQLLEQLPQGPQAPVPICVCVGVGGMCMLRVLGLVRPACTPPLACPPRPCECKVGGGCRSWIHTQTHSL